MATFLRIALNLAMIALYTTSTIATLKGINVDLGTSSDDEDGES